MLDFGKLVEGKSLVKKMMNVGQHGVMERRGLKGVTFRR